MPLLNQTPNARRLRKEWRITFKHGKTTEVYRALSREVAMMAREEIQRQYPEAKVTMEEMEENAH